MNQNKNAKQLGAGIGGQGQTGLDLPIGKLVAVRDELVVQKSAEKLAAAEDEGSTSPLPERVLSWSFCSHLHYSKLHAVIVKLYCLTCTIISL